MDKKKDTFFTHQQKNVLITLLSLATVFLLVLNFVTPPKPNSSQANSVGPSFGFQMWSSICDYARQELYSAVDSEWAAQKANPDGYVNTETSSYWKGIVSECVEYGM